MLTAAKASSQFYFISFLDLNNKQETARKQDNSDVTLNLDVGIVKPS